MLSVLSISVSLIGLYALICYLFAQLRTPLRLLAVRLFCVRRLSLEERYGEWAAVTGSSDGIGKEYAKELARHGINVVLIARNEEKLTAVANEISLESDVETKIIVADFTQGPKVYEHIERELVDIPIAIFVNNAGIALIGSLRSHTNEQVQQLIDTNIVAASQLSCYFFRRLRDAQIKGAIVNVSSFTDTQPALYAAMYAASKAYIRSFTTSLRFEAARFGIHVQLLSPGFVATKINNYSKSIIRGNLFVPTADAYARSAVAQLRDGVDDTCGYGWHHIQNAAFMILPWRVRIIIAHLFLKLFCDTRLE